MYHSGKHKKVGENEFVKFWLYQEILIIVFKPQTRLTSRAVKKILVDRLIVQMEKAYLVLCCVNGIQSFDKPARDLAAIFGFTGIKAISYVGVRSDIATVAYFAKRNNIHIPTRYFTDYNKALSFLKSHR